MVIRSVIHCSDVIFDVVSFIKIINLFIVLTSIRFATIGGFQADTEISKIHSQNTMYFQLFTISNTNIATCGLEMCQLHKAFLRMDLK